MAIVDFQRTVAEAGRIRIGQQVPTSGGRTRPAKLDTFRLTSPDRRRIEEAAALFGGEVQPWKAPAGPQWEVITTTTEIEVIVPPEAMAFSQYYELWSGGGCQRRCTGVTELLSGSDCLCDPEERGRVKGACDIHTRLSLMIRDLPGLGLWRIDTEGWYAARELAGAVEVIAMAAGRGVLLPARLLLEQRSVIRPGKDGKPETRRFPVPRLDPGITPGQLLLSGGGPGSIPVAALTDGAPAERRLTPVPQIEGPQPSIAEQSAPPAERPARKNAAPEIPSSGRRRSAPAKVAGENGYWQARAFAEAAERGLGTDEVRAIAATVAGDASTDGFSMSVLTEAQWEQVHRLVPGFAGRAPEGRPAAEPDGAGMDTTPTDTAPSGPSAGVEEAEFREAPATITSGAFTAWLGEHRISVEYARGIAASMFPGVARLDDQQRELLRRELAKEA